MQPYEPKKKLSYANVAAAPAPAAHHAATSVFAAPPSPIAPPAATSVFVAPSKPIAPPSPVVAPAGGLFRAEYQHHRANPFNRPDVTGLCLLLFYQLLVRGDNTFDYKIVVSS